MPEVSANGIRHYYEEHGTGDAILCIHGSPSSAAAWRSALELSELGRVIAYDRHGFARSERPEAYETSVSQHAEDAAALLKQLDAGSAFVIGRSSADAAELQRFYAGLSLESRLLVGLGLPTRVRYGGAGVAEITIHLVAQRVAA